MFRTIISLLLGVLLAACTASDGTPLITKPGCGLIGCGGVDPAAFDGGGRSTSMTTTYQRIGNTVYGSDGSQCTKINSTLYCN
jgi:hypothetical protein